jgi:hypothetical protein
LQDAKVTEIPIRAIAMIIVDFFMVFMFDFCLLVFVLVFIIIAQLLLQGIL